MKAKPALMLVCALAFVWFSYPAVAYNINELILKELDKSGTRLVFVNTGILGDKGTSRLAKSHLVSDVKHLALWGMKVTDIGVGALAESKYLKNLEILDLFNNEVGPKGAALIARSENFLNLKNLNLQWNKIEVGGVKALTSS